jgi:hypothetical protein
MPPNHSSQFLVDPKRFRTIQDLTQMRPDCGASINDIFVINNELLLIVDMAHMDSIMNPFNSPPASYVRTHGVIVESDTRLKSSPVLWNDPFLLLPLSYHLNKDLTAYEVVGKVLGSVSCSSGTFLLVPIRKDMPAYLDGLTRKALAKKTGAKINIPNGTYRVFFEQFEVPDGDKKEFYRNIAVQKQ